MEPGDAPCYHYYPVLASQCMLRAGAQTICIGRHLLANKLWPSAETCNAMQGIASRSCMAMHDRRRCQGHVHTKGCSLACLEVPPEQH